MKEPIIWREVTNRRKVPESDKRKAYYTLGVLSTSFAEMEQRLQDLLVCFMKFNTPVGMFYVERNNMETNLQLLQNINKWLKDQELASIVKKANEVKWHRNNLIHGTWEFEKRNSDRKLLVFVRKAQPHHREGTANRPSFLAGAKIFTYEFDELEGMIKPINEIISLLKERFSFYQENKPYI